MAKNDLNEEIDELALEIEQTIADGEETLADLPDFEPRSDRSKKLEEAIVMDI